jgi:AbiV family abortive infection protein
MVLTGYEEMAKCHRILDAAHYSHRMKLRNITVEDSVFSQHESKYKITMSYLDDWLKSLDEIRLTFMKGIRSIEPPKKRASRRKIYRQGLKIRNACLYVDYRRGWVDTRKVSRNEVWRNLEMLRDMMGGFRPYLAIS